MLAYRLVEKDMDTVPGGTAFDAGRMGEITIGDDGEAAMADPFVYDASNIDEFAKIF